jgi:hypothetical protein
MMEGGKYMRGIKGRNEGLRHEINRYPLNFNGLYTSKQIIILKVTK